MLAVKAFEPFAAERENARGRMIRDFT